MDVKQDKSIDQASRKLKLDEIANASVIGKGLCRDMTVSELKPSTKSEPRKLEGFIEKESNSIIELGKENTKYASGRKRDFLMDHATSQLSLDHSDSPDEPLLVSPLQGFLALEGEQSCVIDLEAGKKVSILSESPNLFALKNRQALDVLSSTSSGSPSETVYYEEQLNQNRATGRKVSQKLLFARLSPHSSRTVSRVLRLSKGQGFVLDQDKLNILTRYTNKGLRTTYFFSKPLSQVFKLTMASRYRLIVKMRRSRSKRTAKKIVLNLKASDSISISKRKRSTFRFRLFFEEGVERSTWDDNVNSVATIFKEEGVPSRKTEFGDVDVHHQLRASTASFLSFSDSSLEPNPEQITWRRISRSTDTEELPSALNLHPTNSRIPIEQYLVSESYPGVTIISNVKPKENSLSRLLPLTRKKSSVARPVNKSMNRRVKDMITMVGRSFLHRDRDPDKDFTNKFDETTRTIDATNDIAKANVNGTGSQESIVSDQKESKLVELSKFNGNSSHVLSRPKEDHVVTLFELNRAHNPSTSTIPKETDNGTFLTYEALVSTAKNYSLDETSYAALLYVMTEEMKLNIV